MRHGLPVMGAGLGLRQQDWVVAATGDQVRAHVSSVQVARSGKHGRDSWLWARWPQAAATMLG